MFSTQRSLHIFCNSRIQGHANLAPITIAYTSTSTVNRQRVIFDDCLFEENRQGSSAFGADQFGVVTIVSSASDVVIRNSIFRENIFADALAVSTTILCHGLLYTDDHSRLPADCCLLIRTRDTRLPTILQGQR